MIIAVLDTNVLASGFIGEDKPDSTPGELVRRWRANTFTLVVSEHILAELADTLLILTSPVASPGRRLPRHWTRCASMPSSSRS